MIYDYEIEKQVLAALIKEPEGFIDISNFIDVSDFYSEHSNLHSTIFTIIKQSLESGEGIDETIVAQRVAAVGATFADDVVPADYIRSLALRRVPAGNLAKTSRELKKISVRRSIYLSAKKIADTMRKIPLEASYSDIIERADAIYNKQVNLFEEGQEIPVNIYEEMEAFIEDRGENPITDFGMMGPHPKLNSIYGSLLRPGNITVIVARRGVGKTQFCMDYSTKVSAVYDVPVLHFDNGEMSKEELVIRQCAALSGVPSHLLETGRWRQAGDEVVKKVRAVWKIVKNLKFYYYNVGGMTVDEMINTLKRFYYATVGRGEKLIFSFDYIKTTSEKSNKSEHQVVGEMVDKIKKCIQKEILHEGNPVISFMTSVQSNRFGITNNRNSSDIIDDESTVSLSDRIIQFSSHMFILRSKTADEIQVEGRRFGTHKLINVKSRHLGEDIEGAIEPVAVGDVLRKNFINLHFKNFNITECGDLRDIVANNGDEELESDSNNDETPDFERLRTA